MRPAAAIVAATALLGVAAPAFAQGAPEPGRYRAEMCVATGSAAANCGAVQVLLRRLGQAERMQVRVADIVYHLELHAGELDLTLMHGTMQIDGFSAPYAWHGRTLEFSDPDKPVHYRVWLDPGS